MEFRGLQVVFVLPAPLVADEEVRATQEFGGVISDRDTATVRDHHVDFPDGLPPPVITPAPIYECATAIAVHNVPGVELQTEKQTSQGTELYNQHTGVDHTWIGGLGSSFQIGDQFTVRQSLCGEASAPSETEVVEAAPTSVQAPTFDPPMLVAGQNFVNLNQIEQGLAVSVDEVGGGQLWFDSSVPYNWFPGIEVGFTLGTQDELSAGQFLCDGSGQSASMNVSSCDGSVLASHLSIAQPQDGDDFVLVTEGIPSATVRVLDKEKEVGSGSGHVIGLNRPLVSGELISVVQELKGCSADSGYVIAVL